MIVRLVESLKVKYNLRTREEVNNALVSNSPQFDEFKAEFQHRLMAEEGALSETRVKNYTSIL